jgi:hypothetical protein
MKILVTMKQALPEPQEARLKQELEELGYRVVLITGADPIDVEVVPLPPVDVEEECQRCADCDEAIKKWEVRCTLLEARGEAAAKAMASATAALGIARDHIEKLTAEGVELRQAADRYGAMVDELRNRGFWQRVLGD